MMGMYRVLSNLGASAISSRNTVHRLFDESRNNLTLVQSKPRREVTLTSDDQRRP